MKIAVIGAKGQVGSEFEKILGVGAFYKLTREEIDVTDIGSVETVLGSLDCSAIVNLAAFHNLNECESDPDKAFKVNALGVANVAKIGRRKGCKVISFSSDYVFGKDIARRHAYLENDIPGPLNVYGESKLAGEQFICNHLQDYIIVRTSSLFGTTTSSKGWTFPEMIIERAKANERLRVVDDQCMSPTYTLDLVRAVLRLIEVNATGIVHLANDGECSWHELACTTLALAGIDYPVEAVCTDTFPSIAKRPAYSVLKTERTRAFGIPPLRSWQNALSAYLQEKGIVRCKSTHPNVYNHEHS